MNEHIEPVEHISVLLIHFVTRGHGITFYPPQIFQHCHMTSSLLSLLIVSAQ